MNAFTSDLAMAAEAASDTVPALGRVAPLLRYRGVAYRGTTPARLAGTAGCRLYYRGVEHDGSRPAEVPAPIPGRLRYRGVAW